MLYIIHNNVYSVKQMLYKKGTGIVKKKNIFIIYCYFVNSKYLCICFVSDNMRNTDRGHLGMNLFTVKKIIYCSHVLRF